MLDEILGGSDDDEQEEGPDSAVSNRGRKEQGRLPSHSPVARAHGAQGAGGEQTGPRDFAEASGDQARDAAEARGRSPRDGGSDPGSAGGGWPDASLSRTGPTERPQ